MNLKNRLLSLLVAGSIFMGVLPTVSFAAPSESGGETRPPRKAWTGYTINDPDVWVADGATAPDTSWYTADDAPAGTEEDPYIIDTPAKWYGLTDYFNASIVPAVTGSSNYINTKLNILNMTGCTAFYGGGASYATPSDLEKWYEYRFDTPLNPTEVTTDFVTAQTEDGNWFLDRVDCNITINGVTKTIDVSAYFKLYAYKDSYVTEDALLSDMSYDMQKLDISTSFCVTAAYIDTKVRIYVKSGSNKYEIAALDKEAFNIELPGELEFSNIYGDTQNIDVLSAMQDTLWSIVNTDELPETLEDRVRRSLGVQAQSVTWASNSSYTNDSSAFPYNAHGVTLYDTNNNQGITTADDVVIAAWDVKRTTDNKIYAAVNADKPFFDTDVSDWGIAERNTHVDITASFDDIINGTSGTQDVIIRMYTTRNAVKTLQAEYTYTCAVPTTAVKVKGITCSTAVARKYWTVPSGRYSIVYTYYYRYVTNPKITFILADDTTQTVALNTTAEADIFAADTYEGNYELCYWTANGDDTSTSDVARDSVGLASVKWNYLEDSTLCNFSNLQYVKCYTNKSFEEIRADLQNVYDTLDEWSDRGTSAVVTASEPKTYIKVTANLDLSNMQCGYGGIYMKNAVIDMDGHAISNVQSSSVIQQLDYNSELRNAVIACSTGSAFVYDNYGKIVHSVFMNTGAMTISGLPCKCFSFAVWRNCGIIDDMSYFCSLTEASSCAGIVQSNQGIMRNCDVLYIGFDMTEDCYVASKYPTVATELVIDNSGVIYNINIDADRDILFIPTDWNFGRLLSGSSSVYANVNIADFSIFAAGGYKGIADVAISGGTAYNITSALSFVPYTWKKTEDAAVEEFSPKCLYIGELEISLLDSKITGSFPLDRTMESGLYSQPKMQYSGVYEDIILVPYKQAFTWENYIAAYENGETLTEGVHMPKHCVSEDYRDDCLLAASVYTNCDINIHSDYITRNYSLLNANAACYLANSVFNFDLPLVIDCGLIDAHSAGATNNVIWNHKWVSTHYTFEQFSTGNTYLGMTNKFNVNIDEMLMLGTDFALAWNDIVNSEYHVKHWRGVVTPLISYSGKMRNNIVDINYSGTLQSASSGSHPNKARGITAIFTFDETAKGTVYIPLELSSIEDCFVYIDMLSEDVQLAKGRHALLSQSTIQYGIKNVTVLAPHVNLTTSGSNSGARILDSSASGGVSGGYVENLNAYANYYVDDASAYSGYAWSIGAKTVVNSCLNINFYNKADGTPADMPFSGFMLESSSSGGNSAYNSCVATNSTSSQVSFAGGWNGTKLVNCFFDAPNSRASTEQVEDPSDIAYRGGLLTYAYISVNSPSYYIQCAGLARNKQVFFGNCYLPAGQSAVCEVYIPGTTQIDTWNAPTRANPPLPAGSYGYYDGELPDGVAYTSTNARLNGEAAYLLDNGSSPSRRGYNWTVYDDIQLVNPYTGQLLSKWDKHLGTVREYLPEEFIYSVASPSGKLEAYPIYKVHVEDAADGYLTIKGVNSEITSGDIYVKRGADLGAEETILNDDTILVYATQSLNNSAPIRIPSTAEDNDIAAFALRATPTYTIAGYTHQGADTVITPVFKTARYVTVEVEDMTHGTIVPSASVTAAGEKVTVSYETEPGYTITDVKYHTVSDPSIIYPLNAKSFIMPDDDVVITGKVIPFEGGITRFSLFGFAGEIDQDAGTIHVSVPKVGSLNNALPTIEYVGDYITPAVTARQDFTSPVTYTVTYGDGLTKDYVVTVEQSEYTMRIYDFVLNGIHGEINQAKHTISVTLPMDTDLSSLTPSDIVYSAENISPAVSTAHDFRVPVVYTLFTAGMMPVDYIVNVHIADSDEAIINNYVVSGYSGVIDNDANTITLNVPLGLDMSAVMPSDIAYIGKKLTPGKTAIVDLSSTATYDVTAQSGAIRTYTVNTNYLSDDTAKITEFELGGSEGVINEEAKTITVVISETVDIVDVIPDVLTYEGKSIYPKPDTLQDFTQPVVYTVVAPDNTEVPYTVNVVTTSNEALITEFALMGIDGVIDQTAKTIHVSLPYGYDISNTAPSKLIYSENATLTPDAGVARNFTEAQQYTVVSEDGLKHNTYTVICEVAGDYDNRILKYTVDGVNGQITDIGADKGIITLTIKDRIDAPDYNNIVPDDIIISTGATITPAKTAPVDLIENVPQYTVTGRNNGVRVYDVHLEIIPMDTTAKITEYVVNGRQGIINQTAGTIKITAPESERAQFMVCIPNVVWQGASIRPADGSTVDLTENKVYTVTAEDSRVTKRYTVSVDFVDDDVLDTTCIITAYSIGGYAGEVSQNDGTITIRPPMSKAEVLRSTVPDYITWEGAGITPNERDAIDLTTDNVYRVVAEDNSVYKDYRLIVDWVSDPTPPTPPVPVPPGPSDNCIITKYEVVGVKGEIDQTALTITLNVPLSKKDALTNVVPDKIEWRGETLSPSERTAVNVVDGLTYKVTAESGKQKTYTIKLNWVDDRNTDCIITHYAVAGVDGVIDQNALTITLNVPLSQKDALNNVIPDRVLWKGKTLTPTEKTAVTLVDGLTYTVTAENPNIKKTYTIKLNWVDDRDDDCIITYYKALGIAGEIDQNALTITMPIPLSKKGAVENVVPDRIKWRGKTLTPTEQDAVTLADGLTYTVTAENGKQKTYTIKIDWIDDRDDCIITYYKAADVVGAIDQSNLTITMLVPLSKHGNLENIVPDKIKWQGATLVPTEEDVITLEDGLTYTVTAANGDSKTYTIEIEWIDDRNTDCIITAYKVCGIEAEIDQDALTINLEIPEARKQHCTNIAPDYVAWYGSQLIPSETNGVDLTEELFYRVYAENSDVYKDYTVNVKWIEEPVEDNPGPDDDPEDNPNTGIADDRMQYMRLLLAMLIAAGAVMGTRKRKQ